MIDWFSLGFGVLWIFGLSVVIASLSFSYYLMGQQERCLTQVLEMPAVRIMIGLGLIFFCLGWIGAASELWERLVWTVLTLLFALQTWLATKKIKL
jgi:hypothetical protein